MITNVQEMIEEMKQASKDIGVKPYGSEGVSFNFKKLSSVANRDDIKLMSQELQNAIFGTPIPSEAEYQAQNEKVDKIWAENMELFKDKP
jgi:hypothetical protein